MHRVGSTVRAAALIVPHPTTDPWVLLHVSSHPSSTTAVPRAHDHPLRRVVVRHGGRHHLPVGTGYKLDWDKPLRCHHHGLAIVVVDAALMHAGGAWVVVVVVVQRLLVGVVVSVVSVTALMPTVATTTTAASPTVSSTSTSTSSTVRVTVGAAVPVAMVTTAVVALSTWVGRRRRRRVPTV